MLGVIFMGSGITEIHQQTVAQVLSGMPSIASDGGCAHVMVGAHDLPKLFRIEQRGQVG